jgi:hypothetical protein
MTITLVLLSRRRKVGPLLRHLVIRWPASYRTMGMRALILIVAAYTRNTYILDNRLLTVGTTVDEAAFLFFSLENACHAQLVAEAAAANGVPKIIIDDKVAAYTATTIQNPVSS